MKSPPDHFRLLEDGWLFICDCEIVFSLIFESNLKNFSFLNKPTLSRSPC